MANGAEVAFAGTNTLAGTPARLELELESVTVEPPAGAGALRFTVFELVDSPPITLFGVRTTELIRVGNNVNSA
jgi:hypothetical protein